MYVFSIYYLDKLIVTKTNYNNIQDSLYPASPQPNFLF